jgi:hypothetical protein
MIRASALEILERHSAYHHRDPRDQFCRPTRQALLLGRAGSHPSSYLPDDGSLRRVILVTARAPSRFQERPERRPVQTSSSLDSTSRRE